jgi:hypothetical protein
MQVTFYLTEASANTAAGPFNISGTTSGGAANTVEIQAGVSKATLLTGYTEEIANNITGGTVTSTDGTCNTTDTWSINELYVTPTPTPTEPVIEYDEYTGSGYGSTVSAACNDASSANGGLGRTLYSSCAPGEFDRNCYVYVNAGGSALVGYNNVFINGAVWDISPATGRISDLSSQQC